MVQLYGVVCWSYAVGCCIVYGSTLIYYINKLFFAILRYYWLGRPTVLNFTPVYR
jgi:hypothetical protein